LYEERLTIYLTVSPCSSSSQMQLVTAASLEIDSPLLFVLL
jgi:hypothetical protein